MNCGVLDMVIPPDHSVIMVSFWSVITGIILF